MRIHKYANLQTPSPLCWHANVLTGKYANMLIFKCDMYIRICKYANFQIRKCRNMNIHHMEICKNTHTHKFASVCICKYFPICRYRSGCRFSFIWCVVAWLCIHIFACLNIYIFAFVIFAHSIFAYVLSWIFAHSHVYRIFTCLNICMLAHTHICIGTYW